MKIYPDSTKHLIAVDCIIFGYDILEKELKLLLFKRLVDPAKGKWSLAGGFVDAIEVLMKQPVGFSVNSPAWSRFI